MIRTLVPRLAACLKNVAATGWFAVVFVPVRSRKSECRALAKMSDTAPDPIPSSKAATDDA
jgi:hypothetical protein